jgi:hypothetical protein
MTVAGQVCFAFIQHPVVGNIDLCNSLIMRIVFAVLFLVKLINGKMTKGMRTELLND